jgi:crotonobetainyl-CoA:carnitine CoA-transferase CaiB-like acyl-CoA transferase
LNTVVSGPLSGITIVDFSRVLAGPFATQIFGDLGAQVIKVEEPGAGDASRNNPPFAGGESHYFLSINRNKQSVAIDLKHPQGRQVALELMTKADVVIENFRPNVMKKLGLDYETVKTRNPGVVYCSISGFGQTGPMSGLPAYNEVMQALTGLMSMNGEEDGPPMKLGVPVGDMGGGLFAVIGILAAIAERNKTGKGQWVDVALYDSMVSFLGYFAGLYFMTGKSPGRVGSGHHSIAPLGVFKATDGYMALSIFTTKFWRNFCKAVERPDLATDPRFARAGARVENKAVLEGIITELFARRSLADWDTLLSAADVPHARVRSVGEALDDPHSHQRNMVLETEHPTAGKVRNVGRAIKFSGHDAAAPMRHAPLLGGDTEAVLQSVLGYSREKVEELLAQKAVAKWSPDDKQGDRHG